MKSNRTLSFKKVEEKYKKETCSYLEKRKQVLALDEIEMDVIDHDNHQYHGYRVGTTSEADDQLNRAQAAYAYTSNTSPEPLPESKKGKEKETAKKIDTHSEELEIALPGEIGELRRRYILQKRLVQAALHSTEFFYQSQYEALFPEKKMLSLRNRLRRLLNFKTSTKIGTKIAMGLDDVPAAASSMLEEAGPFLLSGAGFYVFSMELIEGMNGIEKACSDETLTPIERRIALTTNGLKIALSVAGLAVSGFVFTTATLQLLSELTMFPNALQIMGIPAMAVGGAPLGMPIALTIIAGVELFQASSEFHFAKQKEAAAKKALEMRLSVITGEITALNQQMALYHQQREELVNKLDRAEDTKEGDGLLGQIKTIDATLKKLDASYFTYRKEADKLKSDYEAARDARLKMERKLGFANVEMVLSLVVLALFTLSVLGGLSVISFGGAAGFALMAVVGVVVAIKVADVIDKKVFDSKGTTAIRNFAVQTGEKIGRVASNLWNKLTQSGSSKTPAPEKTEVTLNSPATIKRKLACSAPVLIPTPEKETRVATLSAPVEARNAKARLTLLPPPQSPSTRAPAVNGNASGNLRKSV